MKTFETLGLAAIVAGSWMLAGCKEDAAETAPQSGRRTTTRPHGAVSTRPAETTMPFAIDPHSGMMMPPSHPRIRGAHGVATRPVTAGELHFTAPATWKPETPASAMRMAQYRIPRTEGDPGDGLVVVSTFPEMRGMTQQNIDRWTEQFAQPEGRPLRDAAKVMTMEVAGMKTTILRLTGGFEGRSGWAMCAAIIEAPEGPWFVKMTGPEKTVQENDGAFEAFVQSARQ